MAIYLVDKPYENLAVDMINRDKSATIVLIQDGVYIDVGKIEGNREIYCLIRDVEKRNISHLSDKIMKISDDELIDLISIEDVYNFI